MAENHALIPEANSMYTQTNMKESQDISKNLMSGDFERQFRGAMVEKTDSRWQTLLITLAVVVGALMAWLLVFTIVREVQFRQLRHEVDELTANMIAMSANVKSLSSKIEKNKLFNEFKDLQDTMPRHNKFAMSSRKRIHASRQALQRRRLHNGICNTSDTCASYSEEVEQLMSSSTLNENNLETSFIYADDDITSISDGKEDVKDRVYDSLEKLHGLTVLEDDNLGDDEDLLDGGEDSESGDWYPDYDKRSQHIGTTNMVHLRPEDFMDSDVSFGDKSVMSNIREIKRRLNENPEDPDLPELQPVSAAVHPTKPTDEEGSRTKRSVFPDSSADSVDEYAAPRMMAKTDERRKTKKFSPSLDSAPSAKMAMHTVTRTVRNSDFEEGVRRPFVAAHFHGNTSHLSPEIHEHYKGNGLVRVSHGAAHDVWYPAPWTVMSPHPRPTLTRSGHVHVHHTGVYLVYVQIYYLDSHDIISWVLHRTNAEIEGRETLLQCAQSSHSTEQIDKPNSCFSAAALFLKAGDRLAVRNTGGDRHSLMQPEKSFIGLVKLADAEDPVQEL